jgi:hypothetical protein
LDGLVCGALAAGGGSGLLCTGADEDLRAVEPVTSFGAELREENQLSLAKREDSELQLTRAEANAAVSATRDQESERMGSATRRIGLLTRLPTRTRELSIGG